MRLVRTITLALALGAYAAPVSAAPILIDFESLADLEELTTQFAGLTFSGATGLQSGALGGSLNEFEFPPLSGTGVVFDTASEIRVDFATGALSVGGYFTYIAPITMTAYSGATVLGSVTSQFDQNTAFGGNPVNELLQLAFASPITHVTFAGSPLGGSFTLDDFSANTVDDVAPVPEPGTIGLLLSGVALLAGRRKLRKLSARPT
jgi:hypothetical protein